LLDAAVYSFQYIDAPLPNVVHPSVDAPLGNNDIMVTQQ
jgi:hypothetical protein